MCPVIFWLLNGVIEFYLLFLIFFHSYIKDLIKTVIKFKLTLFTGHLFVGYGGLDYSHWIQVTKQTS